MVQFLFLFGDWSLLILRVVLGLILLVHGWPKIKNLKATGEAFSGMNFKPGIFWATVAAVAEFIGGILLIAGLFTQIVAILVALQFIVIVLKLKRGTRFAGYELDLLILAAALALVTLGGGAYALDDYFGLWIY